jgi:acyl transferase domain-containing protein
MADELRDDHIAIVGMACRFPGANTPEEFWRNLAGGVESIVRLSEEELARSGVAPAEFRHPRYVNAAAFIDDVEGFDARFFGYTPREAEVRDPQGRLFLECCHAAMEDSGYDPSRFEGLVGVFGGMANNMYGERYVARNAAAKAAVGGMAIEVSNSPDYLATTVSYRLGFRGPSINVQTACSTALVAVHLAGQALRSGDCDYALAGAVEVELPHRAGYTWIEGGIYSRTGQIRPFDAEACGTLFGTGVGVVALKRLSDALADGDHIYAVIRGSAVNNDGGARAGFTAPGVEGQAQLIVEALAVAEVHPDTIGFVEAHATGTLVGDPIEVAGLTRAFRTAGATAVQNCPIGSVKANIGHLGPASGIAGLIKVCLALRHDAIPPTINFTTPNPNLELERSPFYVVTDLTPWPAGERPRRAGISSFGIGGTNAHVVVEEAPRREPAASAGRRWHILPVSAKTATALDVAARRLGDVLAAADPAPDLADVAYTLQVGRTSFAHRRAVAAASLADASQALQSGSPNRQLKAAPVARRRTAMMFPGQGAQHPDMARDLYEREPVFQAAFDECAALLRPHLDIKLPDLVFRADSEDLLRQTRFGQPALFAVEYALAQLLCSTGIEPAAMIGHSVGEYVAAHLAGVFSLPDALAVVAARGRLMQDMAPGSMLAVSGPESRVRELIPSSVEIAAVNGPQATVIAGAPEEIRGAQTALTRNGLHCAELKTSHAFHTQLMEPCLDDFVAVVSAVPLNRPGTPFVSNVTGTWITEQDAVDPQYWARHLRSTVLFAAGISTIAADEDLVLLQVGPGDALCRLARQCVGPTGIPIVASMRHPLRTVPDDAVLAEAIGALWVNGVEIDWASWSTGRRTSLPTYPFERQPFWVNPDPSADLGDDEESAEQPLPAERCVFAPHWREAPLIAPYALKPSGRWLVFARQHPVMDAFLGRLALTASEVTTVRPGDEYAVVGPGEYTVRPGDAGDLERLFDSLSERPTDIVHAFALTEPIDDPLDDEAIEQALRENFYALLHLGQRLAHYRDESAVQVHVVSSNLQEISGTERLEPGKALLLGAVMLMQREIRGVTARSIDLALPSTLRPRTLAGQLLAEMTAARSDTQIGWRGRKRWRLDYQTVPMERPDPAPSANPTGTYLITGGLGGIGLAVAEDLAQAGPATIVLVGRTPVPPQDQWPAYLSAPETPAAMRLKLERLRAIVANGATVVTAQCDVSDSTAVARLLADVRERYGHITGVYHSAGVAGGGMMAVRTDEDAARVLSPKLAGTLALHRHLGADFDFLVLFSSITAATGTFGQVDYCAANNFLDAFARWAGQREQPVYSIGWTRWIGFGMAAENDAAAPAAFRQLQTGARFVEAEHPLLDQRVHTGGPEIVFRTALEPGRHWISAEHRLGGHDVVVGTALLEMIDGAYREAVGGHADLVDVIFLGPIGVAGPTEIRVSLVPDKSGEYSVTVMTAPIRPGSATWSERLRCRLVPSDHAPAPRHDLAAIADRCTRYRLTEQELGAPDRFIEYGEHWAGNVRSTAVGDAEELSRVEIAERFWPESGRYRLHPSLLDTAVGEAKHADRRLIAGDAFLVLGYDRIHVHEPIPPRFWVHIRHLSEPEAEVDTMDILLLHDDGQEIARITGYAERRVDPAAVRAALRENADSPGVTPAEPPTEVEDEAGIQADLGLEVLRRVLHWRPAPHVIVCPEGIRRALRRTEALTVDVVEQELGGARLAKQPVAQERVVETAFAPPDTELQRQLANYWSSSLGVTQIGLDDDFFELGGNSLVAVQLTARMREGLSVALPIASLFDYPTVRALAAHIDAARTARDRLSVAP